MKTRNCVHERFWTWSGKSKSELELVGNLKVIFLIQMLLTLGGRCNRYF